MPDRRSHGPLVLSAGTVRVFPRQFAAVIGQYGRRLMQKPVSLEMMSNRPSAVPRTVSGGWAFSDGLSRWPVSDCIAEAAHSVLRAQDAARAFYEAGRWHAERSIAVLSRNEVRGALAEAVADAASVTCMPL